MHVSKYLKRSKLSFSLGGAMISTDNSCIEGQSFVLLMHLLVAYSEIGMVMQCTDYLK